MTSSRVSDDDAPLLVLARIVDTEERTLDHISKCDICATRRRLCIEGQQLAVEAIERMLDAKVLVDS